MATEALTFTRGGQSRVSPLWEASARIAKVWGSSLGRRDFLRALLGVPEPFLNVLLRSSVPQELVLQFRVTGDCVLQQSRWLCQRALPLLEASVLGMWVATFSPCFHMAFPLCLSVS